MKYQYPTTARSYADEVVRNAPKAVFWCVVVPIACLVLAGVLAVLAVVLFSVFVF